MMAAAPGIVTSGTGPPNAVVEIRPGMLVQPMVLVDQNGQFVSPENPAGILGTGMVPVASNSQLNPGSSFLSNGGSYNRLKVLAIQQAATVRLVYWNGLNEGTAVPAEVAGPNPVKVRASIEVGNGQIAPYRYNVNPTTYASGTTYTAAHAVTSGGIEYVSLQGSNTGNTPASSPTWWVPVINLGNMATAQWNSATAYVAGDIVFQNVAGGFYIAIAGSTNQQPPNATYWLALSSVTTAWDATVTYAQQDQVTYSGSSWVALAASTNQAPVTVTDAGPASSIYWQQVQYYPVHFQGEDTNRDVLIAPGEVRVSLPVALSAPVAAGQFYYTGTLTQPTARTDTVTGTSGSATVTDTSVTAADQGRALATGTGIPQGTYVGTVTPSTSFLMSSSPYVQVNVLATANFTTCQILGVPNQGSFPRGVNVYSAAGDLESHISLGAAITNDFTLSGPGTTAPNADNTPTCTPLAVLGLPAGGITGRKVIAVAGDSIANGTGDTTLTWGDEPLGWCLRMLTNNPASPASFSWTYFRLARGSSAGAYQFGSGASVQMALAAGCTHVLDEWIVNDITASGMTLAILQANAVARWNAWVAAGLKVTGCTSAPNTTSTDSYATVANQTPVAGFGANSLWSKYNAWVLTLPVPLSGYVDVATVVCNTVVGGSNPVGTVWNPPLGPSPSAGSPHPNVAGHIAIAQSVSPSSLFT